MTPTQRAAIRGILAYFESGNGVPVDKAVIRADCAEVAALRAALAEPAQEPTCTGWVAPKNHYAVPVLFNPYTGEPRDVRDVQSDPQGVLIVPTGKVEVLAAQQPSPPADVPLLDDWDILGMWHATSSRVPMCNHYNHFAREVEKAVRQKAGLA